MTEPSPTLSREQVLVVVDDHADYELRCARAFGVGAEVQLFAMPAVLESDFASAVKRMSKRVAQLEGTIGCHGAFMDTIHYSPDLRVREVARARYLQSMGIAQALGAQYVVFHSQYNPLVKSAAYPQIYQDGSLQFWPELVEQAANRGLTLYLENMFDDSPKALCRVVDAIASPHLRLCLDVSHCRIHSHVDIADWIAAYGAHLGHVHLNDCHGVMDDHLALGEGSTDIRRALKLLNQTRLPITLAVETHRKIAASLHYLGLKRLAAPAQRKSRRK